jgi:hypothetical protein
LAIPISADLGVVLFKGSRLNLSRVASIISREAVSASTTSFIDVASCATDETIPVKARNTHSVANMKSHLTTKLYLLIRIPPVNY